MADLPKLKTDPLLDFASIDEFLSEEGDEPRGRFETFGVDDFATTLADNFIRFDQSFGELPERVTSGGRNTAKQSVYITFAGKHLIDPVRLREQFIHHKAPFDSFWQKANSWRMQSGRNSGVGKVLMLKRDFDSIEDPRQCKHEFFATAGGNDMRQQCLCVVGTEAILGRTNAIQQLSPDSVLVVTLGDARSYAKYSRVSTIFNLRQADSRLDPSTMQLVSSEPQPWTYQTLLKVLFDTALSPIFCGHTLNFYHDMPSDLRPPESMSLVGMSGWDAFWAVMDSIGWSFSLDFQGKPWVFSPNNSFPDYDSFLRASRGHLIDSRSHQLDPAVPERVTVCCHARDYQWYRHPKTGDEQTGVLTAGDQYQRWPVYTHSVRVRDVGGIQPSRIILNTEHVVWAPYHILTDDTGEPVAKDVVDAGLRRVAEQHMNKLGPGMRWRDAEFSGCWPIRAGLWFTAAAWYDYGDGLKTRMWDTPHEIGENFDESKPSWDQKYAQAGLPTVTRETKPAARDLYGTVFAGLGSTDEIAGVEVIESDGWMQVAAMSGHVATPHVKWIERELVRAINGTGQPIPLGARVFGRWNYQLGIGGEWVIVATGNDATSLICAACLELSEPVDCAPMSGALALRKNSMLRVLEGTSQTSGSPIVDFNHGPPGTILWTADPEVFENTEEKTIYWTDSPSANTISVKQLRLRGSTLGKGDLWLKSSGADRYTLIMPPKPERSHQFLISQAVSGDCATAAWFGPGLNCDVMVPQEIDVEVITYVDSTCTCSCGEVCYPIEDPPPGGPTEDCYCDCYCHVESTAESTAIVTIAAYTTLSFRNGLLVGSSDPGCKPPQPNTGGSCPRPEFKHWNPCLEEEEVPEEDDYPYDDYPDDDDPAPDYDDDIYVPE